MKSLNCSKLVPFLHLRYSYELCEPFTMINWSLAPERLSTIVSCRRKYCVKSPHPKAPFFTPLWLRPPTFDRSSRVFCQRWRPEDIR